VPALVVNWNASPAANKDWNEIALSSSLGLNSLDNISF